MNTSESPRCKQAPVRNVDCKCNGGPKLEHAESSTIIPQTWHEMQNLNYRSVDCSLKNAVSVFSVMFGCVYFC